jgi:hypothetical protein
MTENDLERKEALGVIGAGLIAAAITALAMVPSAQGRSALVIEPGHAVAAGTPKGTAPEFVGKRAEELPGPAVTPGLADR